jgi:hypothetical protein
MQPRNVVFLAGHALTADVGTPQVVNLVLSSYHSEHLSGMVTAGRAKSALNSEQVPVDREVPEAPQEGWSRGCRRAHVSFWFWQWFRLSPLAPRKSLSKLSSRSLSSRNTPASTSNLAGRACQLWLGGPAPTPGLLRVRARSRPLFPENSAFSPRSFAGAQATCGIAPRNAGSARC